VRDRRIIDWLDRDRLVVFAAHDRAASAQGAPIRSTTTVTL
jgi:hypothetical protein